MTQNIESAAKGTPRVSLNLDSAELASTYEEVSVRQFNHGKVLVAALRLDAGAHVLDVGCGTGRLGAYVADLIGPTGQVVGVDPLPLRIDIARRKHPRFRARVGRAEDLSDFIDQSFDAAYANSVFHWVEDKPKALSELRRVLKPGGRVAINSADDERPHQSARLVREAVVEEGLGDLHAASGFGTNFRVSGAQLRQLLTDAGFTEVRVEPHTFVDTLTDVDDLIAWSTSSSFGNFLSDLNEEQRTRVRARLARKLDALRTPQGIQLERYLVFASAKRP
ncbi:MAG TPA: methyltransferase domain-containing protein [Polyangiales bacterium]